MRLLYFSLLFVRFLKIFFAKIVKKNKFFCFRDAMTYEKFPSEQ